MNRYLRYSLDTGTDKQLKFQIEYQSPVIGDFFKFLKRMGKDSYLTKAGYKIAQSRFPEFKISTNTIYLRGSLSSLNHKVDVTRFPNNTTYRKGSAKMVEAALEEFITEVKKAERKGLLSDYNVYSVYGDEKPWMSCLGGNPLAGLNLKKTRPVSKLDTFLGRVPSVVYCEEYELMNSIPSNVTVISL